MEQEQLLTALARLLERLKVPYLVTGGLAVVVWGRPRFTADIDILVELDARAAERLADELLKLDAGVYLDRDEIRDALQTEGEFGFLHSASGLRVDFWLLKGDAFDESRLKRRKRRVVAGVPIYFSSPEDLVLVKLLWSRESQSTRQIEDIASILALQEKLDMGYLRKWATEQGTLEKLEQLVKETERRDLPFSNSRE